MPAARIALWGTFDVDNYGDHLFPRVAAHELGRRLPGVTVAPFAPYGWLHPTPLDGGPVVSPLGPWSPARARRLAGAHHLVLVGGGELIHLADPLLAAVYGTSEAELERLAPSRFFVEGLGPELEADCPVVWHGVGVPWEPQGPAADRVRRALAGRPYVTVRDRHSALRLEKAGVDRPVDVVPDSALLLDRIMPPAALAARLDRLRAAGAYPPPGTPALVVQGCDLLAPHVDAVVAALQRWRAAQPVPPEVVVLETGRCRGDGPTADALERAFGRLTPPAGGHRPDGSGLALRRRPAAGGRTVDGAGFAVRRLPPGVSLEDLAAAVAGAEVCVSSSLHAAVTALVFGRPFVLLNLIDDAKLDGFGDMTGLDGRVVHAAGEIATALDRAMAEPAPPGLLAGLQARIDRHFDRIAELAQARVHARPQVVPDPRLDAYAVLDRMTRLQGELETARAGLPAGEGTRVDLAVLHSRLARLEAELADTARRAGAAERELSALQATKAWRWLAPARELYGRLRPGG